MSDSCVDMKIDVCKTDGTNTIIIKLEGEFEAYTAKNAREIMSDNIESGARNLIVDLTKLHYLDNSGVGVLVGRYRQVIEVGGNLILVCPDPRIRRVFEITDLDKIFDIYDTVEEAEEAILSDPLPPAA